MSVIDFDLKCAGCEATLCGVALHGVCAKCGSPVGATLHVPAIDAEAMTVARDVFCARCEYNLRTLPISSVCPECGSPVAPSLRSIALCFASPDWLADQRTMTTIVLGCMLLPLLLMALAPLSAVIGGAVVVVPAIFAIPAPFVLVILLFLLCTQDQGRPHPKSVELLPVYCGWLILGGASVFIVGMIMVSLPGPGLLGLGIGFCCGIGVFVCVARSIGYTGARAGSRCLCGLAKAWSWSLVALIALTLTWTLVFVVVPDAPGYSRVQWLVLTGFLFFLAYLLGLVTLAVYRSTLSAALRHRGEIPAVGPNERAGEEQSKESR